MTTRPTDTMLQLYASAAQVEYAKDEGRFNTYGFDGAWGPIVAKVGPNWVSVRGAWGAVYFDPTQSRPMIEVLSGGYNV